MYNADSFLKRGNRTFMLQPNKWIAKGKISGICEEKMLVVEEGGQERTLGCPGMSLFILPPGRRNLLGTSPMSWLWLKTKLLYHLKGWSARDSHTRVSVHWRKIPRALLGWETIHSSLRVCHYPLISVFFEVRGQVSKFISVFPSSLTLRPRTAFADLVVDVNSL